MHLQTPINIGLHGISCEDLDVFLTVTLAVVCSNKHQWPYGNWELSAVADSVHDVRTPLCKKIITIKLWKKQEASHRELPSFSSGQNMKNCFLKTKTRSRLFVFCRRKVVRKFRYQETFAKELVLKKSVFVNYTSWLQQVKNSQFVQPTWKYTHKESCTFKKKINSTICSSKIHPNINKNEIDMTGMGVRCEVTFKDKRYRYIFAFEDVFNNIVFIHPLKGKSSLAVHKELKELQRKRVTSHVFQCHHGPEFKSNDRNLEKDFISPFFRS